MALSRASRCTWVASSRNRQISTAWARQPSTRRPVRVPIVRRWRSSRAAMCWTVAREVGRTAV